MLPAPPLTPWQRKQIALLYHFASLDYLEGLLTRLNDLLGINYFPPGQMKRQRQDRRPHDDTPRYCFDPASQFLDNFQRDVVEDIAKRQFDSYSITGSNQCARGFAEFAIWSTDVEEAKFKAINAYAHYIDVTMRKPDARTSWNDFSLARVWQEQGFEPLPPMRVRPDISARSGDIPPVTGVYISLDDVNASPQFAWAGPPEGRLMEAATFNALGLAALQEVGRDDLWLNEDKMSRFLHARKSEPAFQSDWSFQWSLDKASLAPSFIAGFAFHYVPTTWALVEIKPEVRAQNLSARSDSAAG